MIEFYDSSHSLNTKAMSELDVVNIGYEQCPSGYGYGPIKRPYDVIHFVVGGRGRLEVNGKTFDIKAGDTFLIPDSDVTYYEADQEDPWLYAWVGFTGTKSATYMKRFMDASEDRYVIHGLNVMDYVYLIQEGAKLDGVTIAHSLQAHSILFRIFSLLFEALELDHIQDETGSLAKDVKFYLDTNYGNSIRMSELADRFHVHPNYLTRTFRERYHIPPKQYLMNLKVQGACDLLQDTDLPISTICQSVGIEDQLMFSKIFRKHMGMSPSAYRKNAKRK